MQMVGTVVDCEFMDFAIKYELAFRDAVGDSSGDSPEKGMTLEVGTEVVKTEGDISDLALAIRYTNFGNAASLSGHFDHHTPRVAEGIKLNGCSVLSFSPI